MPRPVLFGAAGLLGVVTVGAALAVAVPGDRLAGGGGRGIELAA